ncbi:hypothetical protein CRE_21803 [Caenorhabditis remanei]|uniref:3'-5' exonuclease domain-containing protein n=1 Tax=Caenorhabditis remanei TaxID=31234 RepID=E3MEK1_CAERE|nr:hypothetical protein CRE_21803 [Caenorhabditis remanei]
MNRRQRQGFAIGTLRNKLERGVRLSPGVIRDLVYFGGKFGFSRGVGLDLFELIRDNNDLIELDPEFLRKLERVLVRRSIVVYRTLPYEQFPSEYSYEEFDHIRHHTTSNFGEMVNIMQNQLGVASSWPLYVDTEGSYSQLVNGSRLALITVFDVDLRMVYLFRVHNMSYDQMQSIRREIVAIDRRIVTFGPEESIGCITSNIQRHPRLSLQAAVDRLRPISKTETMSNWCGPQLRDDQIQYAAMDAIVLHNLNIGTRLDWSFSPPRPRHRDISPIFFDPTPPTVTQIHKVADIRWEMMEAVDWTWDVNIVDILEATNKQLGLATGEKNWEIEVTKQLHILEDVIDEMDNQWKKSRERIVRTIEGLRDVLQQ